MAAKTVSMIERVVNDVPVIMTEFGYKTFSMVIKSIGGFTHRASPTYFRTEGVMETWHNQPKVFSGYPQPSADYIMNLYEQNSIRDSKTLVIGPGLENCCYIGKALGAPVLPSQFIASSQNRQSVEAGADDSNIYVVGHETDWNDLCVWIKPKNLGEIYSRMVDTAETIILYQHDSWPHKKNAHGTKRGFKKSNISILDPDYTTKHGWMKSEKRKEFLKLIQYPEKDNYEALHDLIPHWEFSMEQEQTENLIEYCKERGKKVITISSGDWNGFISLMLFKKLFEQNNVRPTGLTVNSYWCCHPFYESEFLRIPINSFAYGADKYVEEFRRVIDSISFAEKNTEYMVWDGCWDKTKSKNPEEHFSSWGFPTTFKSTRPYDVWCYSWNKDEDAKNPTREWIIPQLRGKASFRELETLELEDFVKIMKQIEKTKVSIF
ncbi:hypothetical protein HOC35_05985 [Candidatus Woesearchaeota archaeon]|jgi:hypothetical protein|nr:hypothetical protein [Candidatus Woesearchaeota archaeon]